MIIGIRQPAVDNNKKQKVVVYALCALLVALWSQAAAQQPRKVHKIGFLANATPSADAVRYDAFRQGLRELGYVGGKNIVIEYRSSEGKSDRLPALVAELLRLEVDIIVTTGPTVTRAAKEATVTIPIVFAQESDPVGSGFVATIARPGGNITGLSTLGPELSRKRLELLKEIVPKLSHVAVLGTSTVLGHARFLKQTEPVARALGLQLQFIDVLERNGIETAFRTARQERVDGLMVLSGPVLNSNRTQVLDLAVESRLPAIYNFPEFVEAGGLMTYGVSTSDLFRRSATYVDKILKGRKPADLPVEQSTKFELLINLKTAKQIGLTIPASVLARADRVIK